MRAKEEVPQSTNQLVWVDRERGIYKWFRVEPVELGEMHLKGKWEWLADDGETYRSAQDALIRFLDRERTTPKKLGAGVYEVDFVSMSQDGGEVRLRTKQGDVVIRKTSPG